MYKKSHSSYESLMASTYIPSIISPEVSFNLSGSDVDTDYTPIPKERSRSKAKKRAEKETCKDWSKWRTRLNDTMIRAMERVDQTNVPPPRVTINRSICDVALSRAVRDKSPTFMKFDMDPEAFVSFGIPRVRISSNNLPSERLFNGGHAERYTHRKENRKHQR